jgi:hypothetical protein
MDGKRLEVKCTITDLIFIVSVIFFLPSTQTYYVRQNPYDSEVAQIQSPLIMPYVERRNIINDQERDILDSPREDSDIPAVLQSLWGTGDEEITDYANGYGNLQQDTRGNEETMGRSVYSQEPLVDLPTGTPESVSIKRSSVIQKFIFTQYYRYFKSVWGLTKMNVRCFI